MRTELRKLPKSKTSWPKSVVKKWLNKKDEAHHGFHSAIGTMNERRKSCSDQEYYDVVKNDFSEEWRYEKEESPVDLKMFVGTWNLGGKSPSASDNLNLMEWLKSPSQADIYVIGFQEIVPLNAGNVLGPEDSGPADKWLSLIRQALNCGSDRLSLSDREEEFTRLYSGENSPSSPFINSPQRQYCLAATKQMVGIFLCVWLRQDHFQYLSNLNVSCVGTGIMGYLGNKGSISISMTLYHTTFCFVCTHLTSGEKDGDEVRRNLDVSEILKRTKFSRSFKLTTPHSILQHQNVIWLGDLNYRLASGGGVDTYELLEKNDWQALLEKDQLRIEKRAGRVFEGWNEGKICFAPTYKYLANSDHYVVQTSKSKEKRRTPAWCDRILWKGEGVKQKWYVRGESKFSDHRPVYSLFSVKVDTSKKVISIPPNYNNNNNNNNNNNTASCGSVSARHTSNTTGLCQAKVQAEEQLLLITRAHSCIETAPRL